MSKIEERNDLVVDIRVDNKDQVISKFSYDKNDKLNKELSDFLIEKTKPVSQKQEIQLNMHTGSDLNKYEVQGTIYKHFDDEYKEVKRELKRNSIFVVSMVVLGIISLTLLVLAYKYFSNFYFDMFLEIASWVFVWEAIDSFFLRRPSIKRRCLQMKKLSQAKVDVMR